MKLKDLAKKYSAEELAEAFVFRTNLSAKQKKEAQVDLTAARLKSQSTRSPADILEARLLQLKFQMEDWAKNPVFDAEKTFGQYLKQYAKIINRKSFELANDIAINATRFSQIVNGQIIPSEKIVYRLEHHSSNIISANVWLNVLEKDIENKIKFDFATRKTEYSAVKNRIDISKTKVDFVKTKKTEVAGLIDAYKNSVMAKTKTPYSSALENHPQLVREDKVVYKTKKRK